MRTLLFNLLLLLLVFQPLPGQELADILEAHYKAAAQEKMQKVETIITTGKNSYATAGFESAFRIFQARPNLLRVEGDYQGSKVIQTYDGETGWKYAPAMGISKAVMIKDNELKLLLDQVQFENPLWNYVEQGATLEIAAAEGGKENHLILTTDLGSKQHFFIDRESHLITKIETSQLLGGSETGIQVLMTEYKTIKGIPFAHNVVTKMNGEVITTLHIEKVEINKKIDGSMFEKPDEL